MANEYGTLKKAFKRARARLLWQAVEYRCVYCGRLTPAHERSLDHVIPRSHGGVGHLRNLAPACRDCNCTRRNTPIEVWCWHYRRLAPADFLTRMLAVWDAVEPRLEAHRANKALNDLWDKRRAEWRAKAAGV